MFRSLLPAVLVVATLFVTGNPPAEASKIKVWHHYSHGHQDKAQFKGTVVSSEGVLRLSRQLKPLASIDAAHVWDVIEDKNGNLFVATGDEGKLYKVAADGKVTVAYASKDGQVFSLALGHDGTVYAGTGPSGSIIAVPPQGAAKVLAEDLDQYVWSLVFDPDSKHLYAGTGPKGRIYRVTPDGKSTVFYTTRQEHVLCLARDAKNMLYAGTDKGGLIYRIDPMGKGFVLYQSNQTEVRSLLVTSDGIYAGTSAPVKRTSGGNRGSATSTAASVADAASEKDSEPTSAEEETSNSKPKTKTAVSTGNSSSSGDDSSRASGAPAASPPGNGENSLYRIGTDGTVRELFRDKTMVLSLLRANGRILVGTGMNGQLFEIDEATKEKSEIARLDHGQIHCLVRRRDGSIVLGTGDPGKLYVLENKFTAKGVVTSEVLDAKIVSKWGALTWKAGTPQGTSVTISVRTGNVAEPDDTWSDWFEHTTSDHAIAAPTARFLQYRVSLATTNPKVTPEVNSLALRYRTTNQAPEITSFEVPDLDAVNLDNPKKLKLKWSATDPNEDELTYNLFVRKDGWKTWVQLEADLDKKDFEWDTTAFPSGHYQVKVVASDRRDNAPEDALSGERVSAPIPVNHVPPTVTVKVAGMDGDSAVIEATATDTMVRLTEASFAVNGKKWNNVFPTDGLFDSKTENFRFKTDALRPGTYVLVLRVRDAAGNVGSGDVVFTVREKGTK
jgi:hypothetical protein